MKELVVIGLTEGRGQKSDERDALALAEKLRTGSFDTTVYKRTSARTTRRRATPPPVAWLAAQHPLVAGQHVAVEPDGAVASAVVIAAALAGLVKASRRVRRR